jgi:serine/threonine protein kinase
MIPPQTNDQRGTIRADRYRLEERLGSGGFATVWRAVDTDEGRDVAIKLPRADTDHDAEQINAHFERARTAHRVIDEAGGHSNVVSAVDGHVNSESTYLVTELVPGQLLSTALETGSLPPGVDTFFQVGQQVCSALAFLHKHDVLYLDLKPENVMLRPDGTPVLVDFNTAVCDQGSDDTLFYEHAYKPIEQTPGDGSEILTGKPADVYACGHVLAHLLTGETHGAEDRRSNTVALDSDADRGHDLVHTILRRATARFPDARFQTCAELARAIEAISATQPPTATLAHPASGQTFSLQPGDRIGRDESQVDVVTADGEEYVSPVHARFEWYGTGWDLRDLSTNGTYVRRGDGWEEILSDAGYAAQRSSSVTHGPADGRPRRRTRITDGDLIKPVDPDYDITLRFEAAP